MCSYWYSGSGTMMVRTVTISDMTLSRMASEASGYVTSRNPWEDTLMHLHAAHSTFPLDLGPTNILRKSRNKSCKEHHVNQNVVCWSVRKEIAWIPIRYVSWAKKLHWGRPVPHTHRDASLRKTRIVDPVQCWDWSVLTCDKPSAASAMASHVCSELLHSWMSFVSYHGQVKWKLSR